MINRKVFEAILSSMIALWCIINTLLTPSVVLIFLPLIMSAIIQWFGVVIKVATGNDK